MCKNPLAPLIVSWARSAKPAGLASFAGLELDEDPRGFGDVERRKTKTRRMTEKIHARKRNALPSHIALMHDTEEEKEKEKDEKIGQNLQKETRHGSRDGEGEGSFSNQSKNPNFRKRLLRRWPPASTIFPT